MSRFNPVDKLNTPPCAARTDRGMALVFVLAIIVLIAGLVVAYLLTATHAMQTAALYKNDVATQQLADTAVNVVIGQIADGTHTARQGAPDEGLVWTSQPGLIRTYGTDGKPYRFYKLYSSADMVVRNFPKDYWSPEENVKTEVPDDWYEHRGLFSDLNEPSLLALDASAGATSMNPEGAILINGAWYYAYYPIVDPTAQLPAEPGSRDGVEGFTIDARRLSSAPPGAPPTSYNPTRVTNPRRSPNPAPMPVRWLYVLRDGQLSAPESSSSGATGAEEVSWTPDNPSAPTRDNPIVGRIAFWADDETCKLNINTASEGTFWDRAILPSYENVPPEETKLFYGVPRKDEWQRTPGHPAMTCLSPVLGMLPDFRVPLSAPYPASAYSKFAAIYKLVPRVGTGGTSAGTWTPTQFDEPGPMKPDQDRLFASLDELLFAPSKPGETSRQVANPQITRSFLEKAKFFLTTSNRAPETNLFNRPRISLWPVQQEVDPNKGKPGCPNRPRSTVDDKLAACATLNGQPYFFQRYSVYLVNAINDQYAHPDIPFGQQNGYGYAPPSSQRADLDWKIPRNQQLYRYLQDLTEQPIPGLAGRVKFSDKLGADRDQMLTSMVDLLRTANDLKSSTSASVIYSYSSAMPQGSPVDPAGLGQIVPLMPPPGTPGEGTKGMGRFPTITEAVLVVFRVSVDPKSDDQLGVVLLLQAFSPNVGQPNWGPLARICIRGLDAFSINGQSLKMPAVATNLFAQGMTCPHNAMAFACSAGTYRTLTLDPTTKELHTKTVGTKSESDNYPFYSPVFLPLPKNGQNLAFSGGSLTVEIHAGFYGKPGSCLVAPPRESLVQTLQLDFPQATFPVPINTRKEMDRLLTTGWGLLFPDAPGLPAQFKGEVRRSIQVDPNGPTHGDLRLLAALTKVPANYFHPHPDYFSSALTAHSMRSYGGYLSGASDRVELEPGVFCLQGIAANGLHGALLTGTSWLGDWDSGGGREFADGAEYWHPDQGDGHLLENHTSSWSPLRQVPSAVVFGSLPVGVNPKDPKPWRTLLFCANPASGKHHPGWQQPRDHYLLDWFQMPVVEPYAISAPVATSGKVNLNCQIAPFTYIRRDTALRGALRGTKVTTVPPDQNIQRLTIDADETLKGFQRRFADQGGCFKTASELCEMFLVPEGARLDQMKDGDTDEWWWKSYRGTGDNLRESPYGNLYSRVTARSDTFTVHYRVQVLTHNAAAHPNVWSEGSDSIASDARGSALLERYVDPDDPRLRDFATDRNATLDDCYKFRVIRVQRFGR